MKEKLKYIVINGFGWSGSSALVDFMREFDRACVPEEEFRILKEPFGVIDLDRALNDSLELLNEDIAIRCFRELCAVYYRMNGRFKPFGFNMKKDFGVNFYKISEKYIDELVDDWYHSHWWFITMRDSRFRIMLWAALRRLHIYDRYDHFDMSLYTKSEEEFLAITKRYIDRIFLDLTKGMDKDIIVLDQAVPTSRPEYAKRYMRNAKVIVVDRDPRDQYIDLINNNMLIGPDIRKTHNVKLFVKWFMRYHIPWREGVDAVRIQFEDLVLKYDETIEKVCDYAGLDLKDHTNPKKYFDPAVSARNTGLWRTYEYQEDMRKIENALPDFIFQK